MVKTKYSYFFLNIKKQQKIDFLNLYTDFRELKNLHIKPVDYFNICCDFLIKVYKDAGIYREPTENFKKTVFRKGKRSFNNRTPSKLNKDNLRFSGDISLLDKYIECCYCFIKIYHSNKEFNPNYSKSYFFLDFISEVKIHNKDIFKE